MDNPNINSIKINGKETNSSIFETNLNSRITLLSIRNYIIDNNLFIERIQNTYKYSLCNYLNILKLDFQSKIRKLQTATMKNYNFFFKLACRSGVNVETLSISEIDIITDIDYLKYNQYMYELRDLLKEIVIDWTKENTEVRQNYYDIIIKDILLYYKIKYDQINVGINCLGVGRLIYEIAKLGFNVEILENSYLKCIFLNLILNSNTNVEEYEIQPFIYSFSNHLEENSPFKIFKFPDISPKPSLFSQLNINNTSLLKFEQSENFDIFITFFAIHKTTNILETIHKIYKILKKGGKWFNFGPLIYNGNDSEDGSLLEVSWENLKYFIRNIGFSIIKEEFHCCPLIDIKFILQKQVFKSIYIIALKK